MEQFDHYFMDVIKNKYFQFSGRAPRREYWYFVLFSIIISLILGFIDAFAGTMLTFGTDPMGQPIQTGLLGIIFSLGLLIPSIAIGVRRMHDIGKSGWWLLLAIIPLIGALVLLYFAIMPSQNGNNQYGLYPAD